jgi:hypothetical protein
MRTKSYWLAAMTVGAVTLALLPALTPLCAKAAPGKPAAKNAAVKKHSLAGDWTGALIAGGQQLRLVFHLVEKGGKVNGTLDSLDQNAHGIPVESVVLKGNVVTMTVKSVGGTFEGKQSGATTLKGDWRQNGGSLPLTLTRARR